MLTVCCHSLCTATSHGTSVKVKILLPYHYPPVTVTNVSLGMNINILEQSPSVRKEMQLPYIMAQTCRDWSAWTNVNVVPQIDSGL